jgi:hypothetical protein
MEQVITNTKIDQLIDCIKPLDLYLGNKDLSLKGVSGIYSFWWLNGNAEMIEGLHRTTKLKGRKVGDGHESHEVIWKWNLDKPYICLYAGKANCIQTRVKQHLELSTSSPDWYDKGYKIYRKGQIAISPNRIIDMLVKRTTACQFRAGLEHLFKHSVNNPLSEKLKHIGFAFVEETDPTERFYLEDLAIGVHRPWFNVDVER